MQSKVAMGNGDGQAANEVVTTNLGSRGRAAYIHKEGIIGDKPPVDLKLSYHHTRIS